MSDNFSKILQIISIFNIIFPIKNSIRDDFSGNRVDRENTGWVFNRISQRLRASVAIVCDDFANLKYDAENRKLWTLKYHKVVYLLSFFWNRILSEVDKSWRIVCVFNVDNDCNAADLIFINSIRVESRDFEDVFVLRLVVEFAWNWFNSDILVVISPLTTRLFPSKAKSGESTSKATLLFSGSTSASVAVRVRTTVPASAPSETDRGWPSKSITGAWSLMSEIRIS